MQRRRVVKHLYWSTCIVFAACWCMLTYPDVSWHILTYPDVSWQKVGERSTCIVFAAFWRILTYSMHDICWPMLSYADLCWPMLTYADLCWCKGVGALVDVCWRLLTYADLCWPMLTYADVCWCRGVGALVDVCWPMLTYADLCWPMLTYADVGGWEHLYRVCRMHVLVRRNYCGLHSKSRCVCGLSTSAWGLKLLVYEALSYSCTRP
jgi:hypothetical protein